MKKKNRNINWEYRSILAGGLWFIEIFVQLRNHDYTASAWMFACLSALLSVGWFVLAYHQWTLLKTIPKNNRGERK